MNRKSKFSIILICMVFLVCTGFILYKDHQMKKMVSSEINELITDSEEHKSSKLFTYDMLEGLPKPVQRYFMYAIPENTRLISFARMKASGEFRRPKADVSNFKTKSYFLVHTPGFIFDAVMKAKPFIWFDVRDKYYRHKASMFVNIFSCLNVLNVDDQPELNQTTLLRWAGEAVMFPTALLPGKNVKWEAIDENSARAVISDGDISGTMTCYFNELGQIVRYECSDRYDYIDGKVQKTGSIAYRSNYRDINGLKLPMNFEVVRILPDGSKEVFWKGEVTDISFTETAQY